MHFWPECREIVTLIYCWGARDTVNLYNIFENQSEKSKKKKEREKISFDPTFLFVRIIS